MNFCVQLFERCREEQPDCVSKVTVVTGDIEEPGLGLSESDLEIVTDNANVVIHSAATIRFTEHIKYVDVQCAFFRSLSSFYC